MKIPIYQVDAFSDKLFSGNPAAVCILDHPLDTSVMQKIAEENNLAETAFCVQNGHSFNLRWFTPLCEVDLCGHATLATAHVLFNHRGFAGADIEFHSKSGPLFVRKEESLLILNFPADKITKLGTPAILTEGIGLSPAETYKGISDFMMVFENREQIEAIVPDFLKIAQAPSRGVIVTAPGRDVDFVSRYFAPQSGINEDPVTGSAHTTLIPYWSRVLRKIEMKAMQLSQRKGYLLCRLLGERVEIGGNAITYLVGEIEV